MSEQEKVVSPGLTEIESRISKMLRSNRLTHFQQRTQLHEELKKAPRTKISLKRAFANTRFIMDRDTLMLLTHPQQSYVSPRNPNFHDNVLEILDRQLVLEDVIFAYKCIRASVSEREAHAALQHVAKNSRNVLVWTFLTSVLDWNIGTSSLRFLIKEQNTMFRQDEHQKYLFHQNSPTFVSERELD